MSLPTHASGTLLLIRHAPIAAGDRLCGRTDLPAAVDHAACARLAAHIGGVDAVLSSPAMRCRQTAAVVFPDHDVKDDERLWEQDFGEHDGLRFSELPDLGILSNEDLARHHPPKGESFDDLCARIEPVLANLSQIACPDRTLALVVHAGVIRAAIGATIGHRSAGLSFEIAPLSLTQLRVNAEGPIAVGGVNVRV